MNVSENAEKLISMIAENGFKAYAVGGCVRDYFLGISGGDVDIASSAKPNELVSVLKKNNIKFAETGIKHGTVTAFLDSIPFEITTFRADGNYIDNRRPEKVYFVGSIEDDLSRRDFTVNAMAFNKETGLIDLFGGKRDIDNKIIRAVGNPYLRFKEDSLRIMRALRFSSVLDFEIEENTSKAIASDKELLKNISSERVFSELMKMLCGKNILNVLDEYRNVIGVIIPELIPSFTCGQNTPWHIYNVYGHMIHAVAAAPENPVIRLVMLLHDIGKPSVKSTDKNGRDHFKNHAAAGAEIAANVLKRFKVSNKIYDKVTTLIKYHQSFEQVNDIKIKHWLSEIGEDYTRDLIEVRIADLKAHNPEKVKAELDKLEEIKAQLERILKNKEPYKISQLAVNGTDLTALGFKGKEIGEKLSEILSLAVDGKLENNRDDIIDFLIKK